uniref:hypothetical protein n=1 Tax=Sahlingia subintegra TaxID=468936 RepID=UPI001FCCDEE2|nr:hypothetical protein MW427_pgp156 [Sahlingia subintegra]UNJ17270.1 hypothetical protein [Sahlingia subintegra]
MVQKNQKQHIDIATFFRMNLGNWLTQKTSYNPNSKQHTTSTSKTYINKTNSQKIMANNEVKDLLLFKNNIEVYDINSEQEKIKTYSTIIYINDDSKTAKSNGKIYKLCHNSKNKIIQGNFELDKGVLKILTKKQQLSVEETIWFINNNLKLSKTIVKKNTHCIHISFASDIKIKSEN